MQIEHEDNSKRQRFVSGILITTGNKVNHLLWPAQLAHNKSHVLLFSEHATQIPYQCSVLRTIHPLQRAQLCNTPRIASSHDYHDHCISHRSCSGSAHVFGTPHVHVGYSRNACAPEVKDTFSRLCCSAKGLHNMLYAM